MGSLGSSIETMSAPAEASAEVIAAPRPPGPPVTIAVLPAREKSFVTSMVPAMVGCIFAQRGPGSDRSASMRLLRELLYRTMSAEGIVRVQNLA